MSSEQALKPGQHRTVMEGKLTDRALGFQPWKFRFECWWRWSPNGRVTKDRPRPLWGGALILTPHYEVEHWYGPLTMRWSTDTDPSLWGGALILTPHYEVEHWYWPLTMRWSIDIRCSWSWASDTFWVPMHLISPLHLVWSELDNANRILRLKVGALVYTVSRLSKCQR